MGAFLLTERNGAVVTVTLNRPQHRNAISNVEDIAEIEAFCAEAGSDMSIRAIVLTGAGSSFCAGGDVNKMRSRSGMFSGSAYALRNGYRAGIQLIPLAFHKLEVPVVAAINGPAIGLGLDLACMCDVRIAADRAIFAQSFVKLGIVPADGGAWLLARVIGMARASQMTLTGDTIDAAEALNYGLVSQVVRPEALLSAAQGVAERIAANPGHATRMAKRLLREGQTMRLEPLLELSAAFQAIAHQCEDHHEAVAAFLDKRAPQYTGQ